MNDGMVPMLLLGGPEHGAVLQGQVLPHNGKPADRVRLADGRDYERTEEMRDGAYVYRWAEYPDAQDQADGAALRRLREALPDGWDYALDFQVWREGDWYTIHLSGPDDLQRFVIIDDEGVRHSPDGPTIAEAASKCVEAMER